MLTLRRIEIQGFGPYADPAVLEFPDAPGVTVVYGDNMRGKTSLLNAIFFSFFGEVRARGARRGPLSASNRDLAAAGQWGFTVTLDVRYDGDEFQIVRAVTPKVPAPISDDDFTVEVYVRRGGTTLGPADRATLLEQMLPRDVARFFLFDGELLTEYEELLVNESETGRKISAAIEQILGVPVLKTARTLLAGLAAQANKDSAKEASKHQETESLGNALDTANQMRDHHVEERDREAEVLHGLLEERAEVEDFLRRREKYAAAVERLRAARATEKQAGQDEVTAHEQLREAMAESWRTILDDTVREAREAAQQAATEAFDSLTLVLRHQAIEECRCAVCEQEVPEEVRTRLAGTVPAGVGTTANFTGLGAMARVAELAEFADKDVRPQVILLWGTIERARMAKVTAQTEIADANAELADSDVEALEAKMASVTELAGKITATEEAIRDHDAKIVEQQEAMDRLTRKIAEAGTPALAAIQRREQFLKDAAEVLVAAVEGYKTDLRGRVEATASGLFLAMTTEKVDYVGLEINEHYGLAIKHQDGRTEDSRSAGAEQVVALALMGALQANAPLRGPIVMDTPFGRLDPGHTGNVVDTLPAMADQIVLFVQEGEIDRARVREVLGARLLREYELERESSRRTRVVEAH